MRSPGSCLPGVWQRQDIKASRGGEPRARPGPRAREGRGGRSGEAGGQEGNGPREGRFDKGPCLNFKGHGKKQAQPTATGLGQPKANGDLLKGSSQWEETGYRGRCGDSTGPIPNDPFRILKILL